MSICQPLGKKKLSGETEHMYEEKHSKLKAAQLGSAMVLLLHVPPKVHALTVRDEAQWETARSKSTPFKEAMGPQLFLCGFLALSLFCHALPAIVSQYTYQRPKANCY